MLTGQASNIVVIYYDGKTAHYLDSNLVKTVVWSGDIKQASRQIEVELNFTSNGVTPLLTLERGREVRFYNNDEELFRGIIFETNIDMTGQGNLIAFDESKYLVQNKDTRVFRQMKASDIFRRLCADYKIEIGTVVDTGYVIPRMIIKENSLWEILIMSLTLTKKQTGRRYFIYSAGGKIHLVERKEQLVRNVLEEKVNLVNAKRKQSIEELRNNIMVIGGEADAPVTVWAKDQKSIERYGMMKQIERMDSKSTQSEIDQRAKKLLSDLNKEEEIIDMECIGIDDVFAGRAVYAKESMTGLVGGFYVSTDSHVFEGGRHMMSVTLSRTDDLPEMEYVEPEEQEVDNTSIDYFGGQANVNAKVRSYEPLVRKYAKENNIEEYTELLLAIMMQESQGKGGDPMQSSESMGKPAGYITDPELSIKQGVKHFADCLKAADMDELAALQSYNFGAGFAKFAKTRGGYSKETALAFSQTMAKKNGSSGYGDPDYVPHVLRYYKPKSNNSDYTGDSIGKFAGSASAANYYLNNFRVATYFTPNGNPNDHVHTNGVHLGIDLAGKTSGAADGKPIYSLTSGEVTTVFINNATAGNGVVIRGTDGREYRYIHMKHTPPVQKGQVVTAGQQIGIIGSTGHSTGPHLDLKIRDAKGNYLDPLKVLKSIAGQ